MFEDILREIRTKEEAELLKEELENLISGIYEKQRDFLLLMQDTLRAKTYELLGPRLTQIEDKEAFLRGLISKLEEIPRVTLILAFEPSLSAIKKFHSFVSEACKKTVFLDIGLESRIIGGAILIYEGKFRDFSFRRIFEQEFEKSREEFIRILEKENPQKSSSG